MPAMTATALDRLGRLVRQRRLTLELSQREAAGRARISDETWLKVENGRHVSERTLARVERALDWPANTIEAILSGDEPAGQQDPLVLLAVEDLTREEIEQVMGFVRQLRQQRQVT